MTQLAVLQSQYQKALRCFLLTKYTTAASACVKAIALLPPSSEQCSSDDTTVQQIEQLRFLIWTLYLNIATVLLAQDMPSVQIIKLLGVPMTTSKNKDQVALQVWQLLADNYGESGNVDPRLISACALMTIKLQVVNVGRQVVEQWYAGLPDATVDYFSLIAAAQEDQQESNVYYEGTLNALELYTVRILPALEDYESAISFCEYNPLISEGKKKMIYRAIEDHKESVNREKERKLDQQRKVEQQARLSREREEEEEAAAARLAAEERAREEEEASTRKKKDSAATSARQERFANGLPSPALSVASEDEDQIVSRSSLSALDQRRGGTGSIVLKEWVRQALNRGTQNTVAVIFMILALLGLLRGFRGQWPQPVKTVFIKLWQTIQMGTKVTYM